MFGYPFRRAFSSLTQLLATKDWLGLSEALEKESIDPGFVSTAIWKICAANQALLAQRLLTKASSASIPLGESHYTAVIECALRTGKRSLAANMYYQSQLFGVMLDAAVYSELLTGLVKGGSGMISVKHVFEEMRKADLVPTAQACVSLLKISIKTSDWNFATKLVALMQETKMELPKKMIEESMALQGSSDDFQEYEKAWTQIMETEEDEQQDSVSSEGTTEPEVQKKTHLSLPRDTLKLPLSFQLIVMPEEPQSEWSDDSGPESGEEGDKGE